MRVDDVGLQFAHKSDQAREGDEVMNGTDLAAEHGHEHRTDRTRGSQAEHVAFVRGGHARDEGRVELDSIVQRGCQ